MKVSTSHQLPMMGYAISICVFLIFCSTFSNGQIRRDPYHYAECQPAMQKRLGIQDGRIKDFAMTASTFNTRRQPHKGRLGHDAGSWSPSVQNSFQWLQIDLGKDYMVTAVYIQGRQGSDEYVREFFLEYSDDKKTWRVYTDRLGIPEVFDGNKDDSTPVMRELVYPVVARYIRFNPQRWNMVISLRVEIVGCPFVAYTASFDADSRIDFDFSSKAWQNPSDSLELRFKTDRPDGVLLYASGQQRDLIMLELKRGYLYFKIDLGSTQTIPGMTEVTAGSLLDDNNWHDVVIVRDKHELTVVVDRLVNKVTTNGLFYRLDLDKSLHLGGVPFFNMDGITVKTNFYGCLQNVKFNGAMLVKDAFLPGGISSMDIIKNVSPYCNVDPIVPITFPSLESKIIIFALSGTAVHIAFDFRTYNADALLVYHQMQEDDYVEVKLDRDGHIYYKIVVGSDMVEDVVRNTDILSDSTAFTDGLWHSFYLMAQKTKINCTVDQNSKVSNRQLNIKALDTYYLGGHPLYSGFKGCIRNLYVAQKAIEPYKLLDNPENIEDAQIGTCSIRDRCVPNPCEHRGICRQSWSTFHCNCDDTGYKGELCHTPAYHISCEMHKQYSNVDGREETMIDLDGSGPFEPFKVSCERNDGSIITYIGHDSEGLTRVSGFSEPGSYVRKITYAAKDVLELEEVINRASKCIQNVAYFCHNAKFLKPFDVNDKNTKTKTWGWWVGRTYQPMHYWGGAAPGSGKCSCGLEEDGCGKESTTCKCDAVPERTLGPSEKEKDVGSLDHKEYLPVLELHLGDTDSSGSKWSEYDIGKLQCHGDNLFDNTVTFDKRDGTLEFPTFEAESAGDIWFQFKTTASDGVMVHCTGDEVSDFLEIRLFQSDQIQFRYDVGNGVNVIVYKRPGPLNDDAWHTIHVEKNRKQAWMKIDDQQAVYRNEDADLVRLLDLSQPLTIGALIGNQDGFVGCMRGLRVNGKLMDMIGKLRNGNVYGVKPGCVGKCASSPCFHGGTCLEGYDHYTCDCSYTPWRGWNCGREVGVNLKENYMVKYEFDKDQGLSASDFQHAIIGFATQAKKGILMQIRNDDNVKREYITVEINNNGGIKIAMDVGFSRVEVNTDNKLGMDYANGQVHVVVIERYNYGTGLRFQVDNYPIFDEKFKNADTGSDTILNNPKYIFIGNNDTSNIKRGFEGCIYRMQVDNIFPLKRAFQDPKPRYITLQPADKMREDMCGFEEITVSPEPIQTRPNQGVLQNVTYRRTTEEPLSDGEKALVGVGCALFIILVVCIVLFCCRNRLEGADYETEEAAGAKYADNPDSAVVYNQTGLPNMPKSYEYFM